MPTSPASDQALRVLLTNVRLNGPGGTESTIRDLAIGLLGRGHRPIVYSPALGAFSDDIRARGIAVIDDLRLLAEPPDIIHGHHFIQTAEALIHFQTTPAIYVCHAWDFWVEQPPKFPQILVYGAVSEAVRDRLVHTEGIDPQKVALFLNAVDLARVPARSRPLSQVAQRAVCFTSSKAHVLVLRAACERMGIALETLGGCGDRFVAHPERELAECDIVFATGRSAIEALCCGASVIVCDARGFGGLVNSQTYERFRKLNFALRALTQPFSIEGVVAELKTYDADDATLVAQRARADASLQLSIDRFVDVYRGVIASWSQAQISASAVSSRKAMVDFLHSALPRTNTGDRWLCQAERDHLAQQRAHPEHGIVELQLALAQAELKALRASRSWRITAPLRRFKGALWPAN